ncbi:hypothetical protein ACNSOO_07435 [Aliarcobacter lanthieri]|uniref:hypothetical protein n=1 Tax=Aliarcobacter lanthieri TaxID=1355374 RepID=UPI00047C44A3|nr:hypothetical protein [Aliarcobacter lanthieri]QKF59465.1 hypothetical protein ALANTH_1358 [Aliarcobacter lanthieri]
MINSNYDVAFFKLKNLNDNNDKNIGSGFLSNVENIINKDIPRDDSLTFENIKGISLEEIEVHFKDEDKKNIAKNLRVATLFSNDEKLSKALFNTVLGQPFDVGFDYLSNKYEDKRSYLKSKFGGSNSLFDLLHKSMKNRLDGEKSQTSKEDLDDILLEINSFDFISVLGKNYKKGYDKYKNDDKYSFLYKNYTLEYQDLIDKYKNIDKINLDIIKQF